MINGYIVNMWIMLIYSLYLSKTKFKNDGIKGLIIAYFPWIVSIILLSIIVA